MLPFLAMLDAWSVDVLLKGTGYSSTCTLLTSAQHRVVVDTGLSIQESELLAALASKHLRAVDIDIVINTHLHVDHCGNNSIFARAIIFMSQSEWNWTREFYSALFGSRTPERELAAFYPEIASYRLSIRTIRNVARMAKMFWNPARLGDKHQLRWLESSALPAGLEVLPTPGHTPHHLSIRTAGLQSIIVAGDAVLAENASAKVKTMIPYSSAQFLSTRQALLARGETIVPGHGAPFVPKSLDTYVV